MFDETFEEGYTIGFIERAGGRYEQHEELKVGKKGTFYTGTIFLYRDIYHIVCYIAKTGERTISDFVCVEKWNGEKEENSDYIYSYLHKQLLDHMNTLPKELRRKNLLYLLSVDLTTILAIFSLLFAILGIWRLLQHSILQATLTFLASLFFMIAQPLFIKFRRTFFD